MRSNQVTYLFRSPFDDRTFSSDKYRFGFNTQEKVDEVSGEGNHNTAEFWEYDTRLGRRWNLDPKPNPSISDYACFGNNPISNSDIKGDTIKNTNTENLIRANDKLRAANERLEKARDNANFINEKFSSLAVANNYVESQLEDKINIAQDNVDKQKDFEQNTDATINEFAITNPEEYKRLNDMPYNIYVESQYEKVQMYNKITGQRAGKADAEVFLMEPKEGTDGVSCARVVLRRKNYKDIKILVELATSLSHEFGHIVDHLSGRPLTEPNADEYRDREYLDKK